MKETLRILITEHAEGRAEGMPELVEQAGATSTVRRIYLGEPLPLSRDFDAIISGGGPMGVYELHLPKYDFLKREADFITDMIATRKAVLGVCLGHQLLAHILGSSVKLAPEHGEIGWFQVTINDNGRRDPLFSGLPEDFWSFHYHRDHVEFLPGGTVALAWTPTCPIQAFRDPTRLLWGVQFHPEISPEKAQRILEGRKELLEKQGIDVSLVIKQGFSVDHNPRKQIFYNFVNAIRSQIR